ncbi:uncharacterized protein SPSK_10484 [Sporothrix schenckii 1099-18]|uniref:Uncharacterized protein n=1 Tax=Sporothrix schenckii 1099-18 TaxID=1397361 RepID=A0A0F2MAK9_SPOSC|nr:uncharacterized protein SPSK_10484 [Sporothrix schenckii 1099-18]KJR86733.1 hypothetical protein SPSK_10484 [Sporothrix schenckii 1099-18]
MSMSMVDGPGRTAVAHVHVQKQGGHTGDDKPSMHPGKTMQDTADDKQQWPAYNVGSFYAGDGGMAVSCRAGVPRRSLCAAVKGMSEGGEHPQTTSLGTGETSQDMYHSQREVTVAAIWGKSAW